MKLKQYIEESSKRFKPELSLKGKVEIISDSLPETIDIRNVLQKIDNLIPDHLFYGVEAVYIGNFPFFKERDINAMYQDGALYITNHQDNDEDMIDDIIHEIAHSNESLFGEVIYSNSNIDLEFVGKRIRLKSLLSLDFNTKKYDFSQTEYSKDLDEFFYKTIGYGLLSAYTEGLFSNPYAATSLREYFASGFEEYYLGEREYLKKISPKLFKVLNNLHYMELKNEY